MVNNTNLVGKKPPMTQKVRDAIPAETRQALNALAIGLEIAERRARARKAREILAKAEQVIVPVDLCEWTDPETGGRVIGSRAEYDAFLASR